MLRQKGRCRTAVGHDRAEPVAGERRHGVGHVHDSHRRPVQTAARRIRVDGIPVVLVRQHTLPVPAGGQLSVRLRAEVLREEVVRGAGVLAQHRRLDDTAVRQLGGHAVPVHHDDGPGPGLQRRPRVLVHRRGVRAAAPRHHVVRGQHGLSDRHTVHVRSGLRVPLEDGGVAERAVPRPVPDAGRVHTGKPDMAAVQRQEREGDGRDLLAEGLGGPARRRRRVPGAGVLLRNVRGTGEVDEGQLHRRVLVVRVDQTAVRVPAAAAGHRLLHGHVDLVPDAVPPVRGGPDERVRRGRHAEHGAGAVRRDATVRQPGADVRGPETGQAHVDPDVAGRQRAGHIHVRRVHRGHQRAVRGRRGLRADGALLGHTVLRRDGRAHRAVDAGQRGVSQRGQRIRVQPDHRGVLHADVRHHQAVPDRPRRAGPEQHVLRAHGVQPPGAGVPLQVHAGDREQDADGNRRLLRGQNRERGTAARAMIDLATTDRPIVSGTFVNSHVNKPHDRHVPVSAGFRSVRLADRPAASPVDVLGFRPAGSVDVTGTFPCRYAPYIVPTRTLPISAITTQLLLTECFMRKFTLTDIYIFIYGFFHF